MSLNLYNHARSYEECSDRILVESMQTTENLLPRYHIIRSSYNNKEINFNLTFLQKLCSFSVFVIMSSLQLCYAEIFAGKQL